MSQSQEARNNGVLKSWIERWVWASYCNHEKVFNEIVEEKKPFELSSYQKKYAGKPALIVGAGISLQPLLDIIKDWDGAIFCPESMAQTLTYYGHKPEYVMVFDAHDQIWQNFLKDFDWSGSTLITHPAACVEMIDKWEWDKIYYVMMHYSKLHKCISGETLEEQEIDAKDQLLGAEFFERIMPWAYKFLHTHILNAGCVVNNSIEVANFMGYGPLFLCGIDFGFKDWIDRVDGFFYKDGEWKRKPGKVIKHVTGPKEIPSGELEISRKIMISDNDIPTTEEQVEYKTAMMAVYKLDRPQLIDCSDGIITELPKASIKEVVKRNGQGFESIYRTGEEIIRIADSYLNKR